MKKVLAISSVLFGVVFLAGCGQQPVSQTQPTTPAPVAQTPAQPVATQPAPTTPALGITEKVISDFSKIGYSSWKTYSLKTLQLDLPTFFDKDAVSAPENFKIIQSADQDLKKDAAYIGSIGCEEADCKSDGGTDGFVSIFSYVGKTPLDALKDVCVKIKSELPGVSCAPKKFVTTSGLEAYELGLEENYWSVGNGTDTYVFSIGNSSGVVQGQKNNLWKTIIEAVRPIKK